MRRKTPSGADHGSDRRWDGELEQAAALARKLAAVADDAADVAQYQPDSVAHVRHHRRIPESQEGGEGEEAARSDHSIDHARDEAGGKDCENFQCAQETRLAPARTPLPDPPPLQREGEDLTR